MPNSTRRDLIKKAAALGLGAVAANIPLLANQISDRAEQGPTSVDFFSGFKQLKNTTSGAVIDFVVAGKGPGLLLLHGYPQTHIIWRKIAPQLADDFTVVMPDLRGYGDSSKPAEGENHAAYSKRALAQDQLELMTSLGFKRFAVGRAKVR